MPDVDIEFDVNSDSLGVFHLKDYSSSKRIAFGKKTVTGSYILRAYETGEHDIPQQKIRYMRKGMGWQDLLSNKVKVNVRSIFENTKIGSDIRPIKAPVSFVWVYKYYISSAFIVMAIVLAAGGLYIRKRQAELALLRKGPPKDVVLYSNLKGILSRISDVPAQDEVIYISEITKQYIASRLGLGTGEMTTQEFINCTKGSESLPDEYKDPVYEFLKVSDLVKFANYKPSRQETDKYISFVQKLLNDMPPKEGYKYL
jgi:hypothetical protein